MPIVNGFSGEYVRVEPFEERHLVDPRYFGWLSDLDVMRYIGREEYLKSVEFAEVREYVEKLWHSKFSSFFAIYHADDDLFIGTAKINYINERGLATRTADIGVMVGDRNYWGRGVATDVLRSVCAYAFDVQNARKLTAGAMAPNVAVIKAFKRIGFSEEARLRKQLLVFGDYVDHILMGCFRDELKNG